MFPHLISTAGVPIFDDIITWTILIFSFPRELTILTQSASRFLVWRCIQHISSTITPYSVFRAPEKLHVTKVKRYICDESDAMQCASILAYMTPLLHVPRCAPGIRAKELGKRIGRVQFLVLPGFTILRHSQQDPIVRAIYLSLSTILLFSICHFNMDLNFPIWLFSYFPIFLFPSFPPGNSLVHGQHPELAH